MLSDHQLVFLKDVNAHDTLPKSHIGHPFFFNIYNSNMDLQFPALDKSLKPLFTLGKVLMTNLDYWALEKKENRFSIFVTEVSSHINPSRMMCSIACTTGWTWSFVKFQDASVPSPKKFLDVSWGKDAGWVGADLFFFLKPQGRYKKGIWNSLFLLKKNVESVWNRGQYQTDNKMVNSKILNGRHYTNWSSY